MSVPEFHCKSKADLAVHIESFTKSLGFHSFGFVAELKARDPDGVPVLHFMTNAAPAWRSSIEAAVKSGEPHNTIRHSTLMLPPLGWSSRGHIVGHSIIDGMARNHVKNMGTWGIGSGLLCPVAAPELEWGSIGFFAEPMLTYEELSEVLPIASLYSSNFIFWFLQVVIRGKRDRGPQLTKRETECLAMAALGKTSIEIGAMLGISDRTVEGYIVSSCDKLNARGRQAAIAKASQLQLIGGRNSLTAEFERQRDEASKDQTPAEQAPDPTP